MAKKNEIDLDINYQNLANDVFKEMGLDQDDEDEVKEEENVEEDEEEDFEDEEDDDEDLDEEDDDEEEEEDEDEEEDDEEDDEDQNLKGDESYEPTPNKEDKAAHAFKELRTKTQNLESKIKSLDSIAQRYGFKDHAEMMESLEKDSIKKQAEKQGLDPKIYAELENTKKRLETLESENKAKEQQLILNKFLTELDSFAKEVKLTQEEKQSIIEKMDADGYTVDMLTKIKNPRVVFKGYTEDKIVQKTQQKFIEKEKKKTKAQEEKFVGEPTNKKISMDKLAEWAIKQRKTNY
jgi:hypothetical protein